jgi:hypothetical protein
MSRKQLGHLCDRLAADGPVSSDDLALLEDVVGFYDEVRSRAQDSIRWVCDRELGGMNVRVTGRTKTTLTLRDKLRRTPAVKLPYVRDIAGVRVVAEMRLQDQDRLAEALCQEFDCTETAKRVDRRADPIAGYRALHVVLTVDGTPVEVQLRTELQALWADLYERQADLWGRQVRYGGGPDLNATGSNEDRKGLLAELVELSVDMIATFEQHLDSHEPESEEEVADREAEARRLLRKRTKESLRQATELRARQARLRLLETEIGGILDEWSKVVRERLNRLADRADNID